MYTHYKVSAQELTVVIIYTALQKSSSEGQSSPHSQQQQGGSVSSEELDKLRSDYSDKKQQVIHMREYSFNFEVAHFCLILGDILAITNFNLSVVSPCMRLCRKESHAHSPLVIRLVIRLLLRH